MTAFDKAEKTRLWFQAFGKWWMEWAGGKPASSFTERFTVINTAEIIRPVVRPLLAARVAAGESLKARGQQVFAAREAAKSEPSPPEEASSIAAPAAPEAPEAKPAPNPVVVFDQRSVAFQHSKSPRGIASSLENALVALTSVTHYHDKIVVRGTAIDARGDVLDNLDNVTLKVRQAVLSRFGFDPGANFTFTNGSPVASTTDASAQS
jgi:hypothetical protein